MVFRDGAPFAEYEERVLMKSSASSKSLGESCEASFDEQCMAQKKLLKFFSYRRVFIAYMT